MGSFGAGLVAFLLGYALYNGEVPQDEELICGLMMFSFIGLACLCASIESIGEE